MINSALDTPRIIAPLLQSRPSGQTGSLLIMQWLCCEREPLGQTRKIVFPFHKVAAVAETKNMPQKIGS